MSKLKVGDLVRMPDNSDYGSWSKEICEVTEVGDDNFVCVRTSFNLDGRAFAGAVTKIDPAGPYRDALFAVDPGASVLSGLVRSLNKHMDLIWYEARKAGQGTAYVNRHPAVTLFLSQMVYLNTGDSVDTAAFAAALDACQAKVAEADKAKAERVLAEQAGEVTHGV